MASEKLTLARLKKFGKNFELSVDPDKALAYKKGEITDIDEVLLADQVFVDAKKGIIPSQEDLEEAFTTTNIRIIADIIVKEGEIQLLAEHRTKEREQRQRKLINLIHTMAVDPKTGFPHPPQRIEAALEQAKVHLDDHLPVEEQLDEVIKKLRPIIPLSIEQKQLTVTITAKDAGKLYQPITSLGKVLKDDWQNDGSWKVVLELPAGLVQEAIGKLNSWTHGEVQVEIK